MDLPTIDIPAAPPAGAPPLPAFHVEVHFGAGIPADAQGRGLLALERYFRETLGVPAECYKATMRDDLKRRRDMTDEDRKRL
jgi:hypothetical protein